MPPQIVKAEALHKVAIIAVRLAIVPIVRRAPAVPDAREPPRETEADSGTDKRDQRPTKRAGPDRELFASYDSFLNTDLFCRSRSPELANQSKASRTLLMLSSCHP